MYLTSKQKTGRLELDAGATSVEQNVKNTNELVNVTLRNSGFFTASCTVWVNYSIYSAHEL